MITCHLSTVQQATLLQVRQQISEHRHRDAQRTLTRLCAEAREETARLEFVHPARLCAGTLTDGLLHLIEARRADDPATSLRYARRANEFLRAAFALSFLEVTE